MTNRAASCGAQYPPDWEPMLHKPKQLRVPFRAREPERAQATVHKTTSAENGGESVHVGAKSAPAGDASYSLNSWGGKTWVLFMSLMNVHEQPNTWTTMFTPSLEDEKPLLIRDQILQPKHHNMPSARRKVSCTVETGVATQLAENVQLNIDRSAVEAQQLPEQTPPVLSQQRGVESIRVRTLPRSIP